MPAGEIYRILSDFFARYGYWTVALGLLLENTGLPVPGETVLLFASFLAYSKHELRLPYIILAGILAATAGDNAGYAIGRWGGRPLLERYRRFFHLTPERFERGERLIQRHGPVAIFLARFIFGLRVLAGPLAGALHMRWTRFLLFNFLGAACWVTTIALLGYAFGSQFGALVRIVGRVDLYLLAAAVLVLLLLWRRRAPRRK